MSLMTTDACTRTRGEFGRWMFVFRGAGPFSSLRRSSWMLLTAAQQILELIQWNLSSGLRLKECQICGTETRQLGQFKGAS